MYDITKTRMLLTTAVFATVAALYAGGANAMRQGNGGTDSGSRPAAAVAATVDPLAVSQLLAQGYTKPQVEAWTVGACSHGVKPAACFGPTSGIFNDRAAKVDPLAESYLIRQGLSSNDLTSWTVGACSHKVKAASCSAMLKPTGDTAAPRGGQVSLGLTGDSALTRVSAPEPLGLTGDAPVERVPSVTQAPVASGSNDVDWSSFGLGAGLGALVAAGIAGVWVTTRRRVGVALP